MRWLRAPLDDYLAGLERVAADGAIRTALPRLGLGLILSWWIYVPLHELLHAYGCLWSGGSVSRLEIDAVYGAAWLQAWFPFVAVGSQHAGQLVGFDTAGSDAVYLVTCFAPFVLTLFPGLPLLRYASRAPNSGRAAWCLGASIPLAYAPFISLPGDFYEIGSILVTRVLAWIDPPADLLRWRSDDLVGLIKRLAPSATALDGIVVSTSFGLGALLAWLTYTAGRAAAEFTRRGS